LTGSFVLRDLPSLRNAACPRNKTPVPGHIDNYLFLLLDELCAPEALMGLSLSVTCIAESVVFYHSGAVISRLGSRGCFHVVFAAFVVRLAGYAALPSAPTPWLVLPLELLHGVTFALTWAAGTEYCGRVAPPGLESTTQSCFQGLLFGVGHGAGGLAGGRVYAHYGARAMFEAACMCLAAAWAATAAAWTAVDAHAARRREYAPLGVQLAEEGALPPSTETGSRRRDNAN
jgi:MFS family permease